jgi:rhamnosyltransferase
MRVDDEAMNNTGVTQCKNGVCAVLVTFRPDPSVETNLGTIRPQVEAMVVVDNSPSNQSAGWLRNACARLSIQLIENKENLGLPAALNIGIEWILINEYPWAVLLDQDSTATDGMIDAMLAAFTKNSEEYRIGIVAPRYVNRETNAIARFSPPFVRDNILRAAYTSGSLIPARVLAEVGGFELCLFLDRLDTDFSLRVRNAGYSIIQARNASLMHEPGFPREHRLFRIFSVTTSNQGPARHYYRARNLVWIAKTYYDRFPDVVAGELAAQARELIWQLVYEENRWKMLTSVARGLTDGMMGRMGKTVEL